MNARIDLPAVNAGAAFFLAAADEAAPISAAAAVLAGIEQLAGAHRVLSCLATAASSSAALRDGLDAACPTWRSAVRGEHGFEVIGRMAALAAAMLGDEAS